MNKLNRMNNFIHTSPGFQYSINIKYDYGSIDKIANYIVSTGALEIIEDVLLSTYSNSTQRARMLSGPYGKGKSHLVLVLLAVLTYKENAAFKQTLLDKVEKLNPDVYKTLYKVINENSKLLPVIISGQSLEIQQSFLFALKESLSNVGLSQLVPDTYYNLAIETIYRWKNEYKETYENLVRLIHCSSDEFIKKLEIYDRETYEYFVQIYPKLTSGSEFNPVKGIDIVELYKEVSSKISEYGYKGIYVVYDEFSKYLEGSIGRNSAMEIKMLQDFAEACSRSKNDQLHILLISHKSIDNYVDKLPKEKIDAWKAVAERFKSIEIKSTPAQTYSVIKHAITKEKTDWEGFVKENSAEFEKLTMESSRNGIIDNSNNNEIEDFIFGCFPLHPISTFILPRISEKVAQNERTLFTFLSTTELNTLGYFLKNTDIGMNMVTSDIVYDYFETLIKKENHYSEIFSVWKKTLSTLNKVDDTETLAIKIIKILGLIKIVDDSKLTPSPEILSLALASMQCSREEILSVLDSLINRKILYHYKAKNEVDFIDSSDINVAELITDTKEKRKNVFSEKKTLIECLREKYLYPTRYNDEYEITRYFEIEFIDIRELKESINWDKKIQDKIADGIIYAVVSYEENDYKDALNIIKNIKCNRAMFILSRKIFKLEDVLREYDAIKFLIEKNQIEQKDKLLNNELQVYFDDIKMQISEFTELYLRPEFGICEYYRNGRKLDVFRRSMLNRTLSDICNNIFSRTPVIINEAININEPSSVAISNRRKVLDSLLKNKLESRLGLIGYGQDVTIMQSTLMVTNILKENEENTYLCLQDLDEKLQNVIDIIKKFLASSCEDGMLSFSILYDELLNPNNQIYMRRGIIPIYIAAVLNGYKRYTVIKRNGYEMEINGRLLEDINNHPEQFDIYIEGWDSEKEKYINELENAFKIHVIEQEKEYNTFDYIVKAMQRWFLQLPKYSKDVRKIYIGHGKSKDLDRKYYKLREELKKVSINSRDFLFVDMIKILGCSKLNCIVNEILKFKNELDSLIKELVSSITKDLKKEYSNNLNTQASLYSLIKDWYDELPEETKTYLHQSGEDRVLEIMKEVTNDEEKFISRLSKEIIGLRINDWNEDTIDIFLNRFMKFKEVIDIFSNKVKSMTEGNIKDNSYSITFHNSNKNEITKIIDKTDLSKRAFLAYTDISNILNNEYGNSLDLNEKRQIILKIFENLC